MMNLSSVFLIFTGLLAELFALQAVSLKGTAVLPCYRTQNTPAEQQDVIWRIAEGQLVAQWSRGRFTAGPGYEGRVQLFAKEMEDGNFSLAISPVEYNDKGSYDCYTGFDHLAVVELGVSVSTDRNITAQVGDPVTLPCYANVSKQANLSHLNIRWEKDGQTVLDIQSGTGSGFENRVSLSPDRVLVGDLSLTISAVLFSDRGAYRCFFSNDIGTPEGIILSIAGRQSNITIQSPESLFLPLHIVEPVRVLFSSGGCTSVSVCTVEGDSVDCGPQYQHRASVHNSTLMLEYTTPADSGVYRVMDNRTNDTINTVSVSVTVSPTVLFLFLSVLLLLGALVLLWMTVQEFKKKKKITLKHKLYLLFLVVMLLLNLVLVALSVTVTFKPGHKELYVALGAGLGLFLAFKMVIMSMTCEKLVKIRKEKTLGGTLKLVLLLLLMLLVLLVTTMMLPQQKWLNWIPFPVLGLFMILHVMIIYKPLQYFQEVMRTVQKIENSNWYEQLQELHAGLVVPLIVLLLLWVVQLVLSVVLVVKELWEGINLGLLWGLTVGDGILIMLLFLLCLHAGS